MISLASKSEKGLLLATAYHEAGHAVMGYRFSMQTLRVVVDIATPGSGRTHYAGRVQAWQAMFLKKYGIGDFDSWSRDAERHIICDLAGPLAEARYLGGFSGEVIAAGVNDYEHAEELLTCLHGIAGTPLWISKCQALIDHVGRILRVPRTWGALAELANALAYSGDVSGDAAERLFDRWRVPRIR